MTFENILRSKLDARLNNRQVKKDEKFEIEDRIVTRFIKRTEWLGMPIYSDAEYEKKFYADEEIISIDEL